MKKTLLSVLAGLTVIGSASAAPTPEDRKALCDLLIKKGTHVWVEKTSACIPVNPCESDDIQIKRAYCIEVFEDIQVKTYAQAAKLSEKYIEVVTKESTKCGLLENNGHIPGSQDYINCKTDSGMYFALEFDDFTDTGDIRADIAKGTLIAFNHEPDGSCASTYVKRDNTDIIGDGHIISNDTNINNTRDISITGAECEEMADFASKVSSLGRGTTIYYSNNTKDREKLSPICCLSFEK